MTVKLLNLPTSTVFIKTSAIGLTVVLFEENVPPLLLSLFFSVFCCADFNLFHSKPSFLWLVGNGSGWSFSLFLQKTKLRSCIHLGQLTPTVPAPGDWPSSSTLRRHPHICDLCPHIHIHLDKKKTLLNFLLWINVFHEFWAIWSSFLCLFSTSSLS